ncbi:hypothetical protein BGW80DRAFT_339810 [Lactifluus volemus]|nr:hypothetical protein BGW80DRAFT_339810 [Lactifluus volemus]
MDPHHGQLSDISAAPIPNLVHLFHQLTRSVSEAEKNLSTDPNRQALLAKLDAQKRLILRIREMVIARTAGAGTSFSGDDTANTQQAVDLTWWLGTEQQQQPRTRLSMLAARNISVPSPAMQASTSSSLPSTSSAVATTSGAPSQQSPQMTHSPPSQQPPIRINKLPVLPEDRFKDLFVKFSRSAGIRISERDFTIEGRLVNPWLLHRAVISRGGFVPVTTNDEWPIIGCAVGFPSVHPGDASQPPQCTPVIAQRLQQLYNGSLRLFDQVYVHSIIRLRRSLGLTPLPSQLPPRPQPQLAQRTLLAAISQSSPVANELIHMLLRFAHTSRAELEARRVPQNIIAFVEGRRDFLQREAQAGLASRPAPQLMAIHQLRQLQRQSQVSNNGIGQQLVRLSTAQSIDASGVPSTSTSTSLNGEALGQGRGVLSNPIGSGMNRRASAGLVPIWQPTREEIAFAQRWIEEQKAAAFSQLDGVSGYSVPESDIPEYRQSLDRLDMVLAHIERYIHIAHATLKRDDIVRRLYTMVASTRVQLEEMDKPNPRYILELHTILGMIQEAINTDNGLKTVLHLATPRPSIASSSGLAAPQAPQPSPTLDSPASPSPMEVDET